MLRFFVKKFLFAALLVMVFALVQAQDEKVIVIGHAEGAEAYDPAHAFTQTGGIVNRAAYDTLVTFPDMDASSIEPLLASSWTISDDGLVYTFSLDAKATFANGDPVEAEDVVFSFNRLKNVKAQPSFLADPIVGLEEIGAGEASSSLNIARLASLIFFQNFTFGAIISTFSMALLFAVPAYFLNAIRFYVIGIPFGYQGFGSFFEVVLALILFVVELMAYVLITAGGGMFLITLIRQGFKGLNLAFRKLAMMLPIAMLLLVIGAWYEALVIAVSLRLGGS